MNTTDQGNAVKRSSVSSFLLLHISFLIYSFVIVLSKKAAMSGLFTTWFFVFAVFEFLTFGIYALLWQQVLARFKLITAYSSKGVVVIWNLIWAAVLFNEQITIENLVGSAFVVAGIILVSSDAR